jgi:thiamine-phosphate pyrophosphorylase
MLCLVTDRLRLAGRAATLVEARRCLAQQTRFAVDAGIDLIQVRERDLEAAVLTSIVRELLDITRGSVTRLVVNDRVDVALACGADGVHLREDSFAASEIRRIAPAGFLVGRSVHSVDAARAAGPVDYLIAGTVFPSASKDAGHVLLGLDGLRAVAASTRVPVLAIGGMTTAHFSDVAAAGGAGCAAIDLFMGPADAGADDTGRAVPLWRIVTRAHQKFDTVKTRP